jgi:glycosyltransferase involved in cell wall biosynthesis
VRAEGFTHDGPAPEETRARRPHRLLLLAPFAPRLDAPHGSGRSIAQLVSRLAERHDVALLAVRAADEPHVDDLLRQRCHVVEEFVRRGTGGGGARRVLRLLRLVGALVAGRPTWVADVHLPELSAAAKELVAAWKPDLIQIELEVMAQYRPAVAAAKAPVVLTQHESASAAARDALAVVRGPKRVVQRLEARAWHRFEPWALSEADAIVTFTDRDRREVQHLRPDASVFCIPLAVELPERPLSADGAAARSIVFVGHFMHPPNVDAARRLVSDILPRLEQSHPGTSVAIVGDGAPRQLADLAHGRAVVTGRVPDVTPYLDAAAVVAVPIRLGGGTRVKVLEALAAGKAVVASPRALEGLDVVDGEHVLVAETDGEFAAAIGRLFDDQELRRGLAERARRWACANVSWERSVSLYEQLYEKLLASDSSAAAS